MRTHEGGRADEWPATGTLKMMVLALGAFVLVASSVRGLPPIAHFAAGFAMGLLIASALVLASRAKPLREKLRSRFGRARS